MPNPFLTAEWQNLVMANYAVDPEILKPYLPCSTELDSFENIHYVSLVGFLFANTKVRGIAFPLHRTFEEVNLRFYVRFKEAGGWKRGVVFIKEIVPKRAITLVANTLYGENYATHRMKHEWKTTNEAFEVSYEWRVRQKWNFLKVIAEKNSFPISEGSEAEFITEHYWGYTQINAKCTGTYEVMHPKWNVYNVNHFAINCDAETIYGQPFAEALAQKPVSVLLADGSPISIMKGTKIFAAVSSSKLQQGG